MVVWAAWEDADRRQTATVAWFGPWRFQVASVRKPDLVFKKAVLKLCSLKHEAVICDTDVTVNATA
jgi:hypothetical protein